MIVSCVEASKAREIEPGGMQDGTKVTIVVEVRGETIMANITRLGFENNGGNVR